MADGDIAVIGSGIVGASVAYHLARRTDRPVTVLERGHDPARGTSNVSSGGLRFYGDAVALRLKRYATRVYTRFLEDPRRDTRFTPIDVLRVATTPATAAALREAVSTAGPDEGPTRYLSPRELTDSLVIPHLAVDAVTAAAHRPHAGYFPPRSLALEFLDRARDRGVTLETDTTVTGIRTEGDRVTGVELGDDARRVRDVVCAAGAWSAGLARTAGVELPVRHTPIHRLDLAADAPGLDTLPKLRHLDAGVSLRGTRSGSVLAYVAEAPLSGFEDARHEGDPTLPGAIPDEYRDRIRDAVTELVPALADVDVVDKRAALVCRTPDARPIAGPTPVRGLSVVGLNSRGIQFAPGLGRIVADAVVDDRDPPAAVAATRFTPDNG